jgi:hypothetical protein
MKSKKFEKKLALNKKTIADLNGDMMGRVHGGIENTQTASCCMGPTDCPNCTQTCNTYCGTCAPTCAPTCDATCVNTCPTCDVTCGVQKTCALC